VNVLVVSGSSPRESLNTRLARLVAALRPDDATRVVLSDLTRLPFYDADVEAAGTPEPVAELRTAVQAADLLVLVTPEYNGSVPGLLANAIDWLSRPHRDAALRGASVLVLSPSGGTRPGAPVPPHSSAPC
jgi:chromate reductase, NAD(P)H dehydrogenase (quinone)